jgi:hypothetical protein
MTTKLRPKKEELTVRTLPDWIPEHGPIEMGIVGAGCVFTCKICRSSDWDPQRLRNEPCKEKMKIELKKAGWVCFSLSYQQGKNFKQVNKILWYSPKLNGNSRFTSYTLETAWAKFKGK